MGLLSAALLLPGDITNICPPVSFSSCLFPSNNIFIGTYIREGRRGGKRQRGTQEKRGGGGRKVNEGRIDLGSSEYVHHGGREGEKEGGKERGKEAARHRREAGGRGGREVNEGRIDLGSSEYSRYPKRKAWWTSLM